MPNQPNAPKPADYRCPCGSLLAKRVEGGLELYCRHCKRTIVVAITEEKRSE